MMRKIQQAKQDDTELIRRTHPSFISVTTTTMLGGPCHIACYAGFFFFCASRERAMGACLRDFSLRPKEKKKQEKANKQTKTRASPSNSLI